MLGLAVGDALGTTLEFKHLGSFKPVRDMIGSGPFNLKAGEWTDDTSMALCLAASMISKRGFDPADQLERYHRWYREGYMSCNGKCFDIGNTVRSALLNFERTREPYCGPTSAYTAGNGSIMRLAPVPLFYARDPQKAIEMAGESSRTTHQAVAAIEACKYLAALTIGAISGVSKRKILSKSYSPVPRYWARHSLKSGVKAVADGSFKRRNPPDIKGSGFVVESLEAALWAFYNSNTFEEGCLKAVNLGDDADTTGAVYGQLAGAFYGEKGIPARWLSKLIWRDKIRDVAGELFALSGCKLAND